MGSKNKYPLLSLAHKALDNTALGFPCHPWELSGLRAAPSEGRRALPFAYASIPSPPQQSASACAALFGHVPSASADFQLTRDPAPAPCTSFVCLSKHVTHSSLPSPGPGIECLWLYSFKDSELRCALFSTALTTLPISMLWIKWEWFNLPVVHVCVSLNTYTCTLVWQRNSYLSADVISYLRQAAGSYGDPPLHTSHVYRG